MTAGLSSRWSDAQEMNKSQRFSGAECHRAAFWSTQQHSQQFLSPQQFSSLWQLHFLQTDWYREHQAATVICFNVGLSDLYRCHSLSVHLSALDYFHTFSFENCIFRPIWSEIIHFICCIHHWYYGCGWPKQGVIVSVSVIISKKSFGGQTVIRN